jgi:capsular polysaccharide transport system permease protein
MVKQRRNRSRMWRNLRTQLRVIGALLIREIHTRFGRENIGFAWIVAEPLVFAMPVLGMWSLIRSHLERGVPVLAMAWSGYLPLLMFRHMIGYMMHFVRVNGGLLYHRQVTVFDLFCARVLLEMLSNFAALLVSGAVMILLGVIDWPRDMPMFYLGYLFHTWWCVALSLIVGGLSERNEIVEKVWGVMSYMYMAVSGFFFLAEWLPKPVRDLGLTLMPSIHCYEMIREGLFGQTFHAYYNIEYLSIVLAVMTLIGLKLVRDARLYLVLE